jgi:glycine/D-amino acid oxidase-like deaminating enzyme
VREVDYIVVGLGIAGISFCEQLEKHHKSYLVIDPGTNAATKISGGVFNPVVLKRFTIAWKAKEEMARSLLFYKELSDKLKIPIVHETSVLRILNSVQEQNDWIVASDKIELSPYIDSEILKNNNPNIKAPFGFGRVKIAGRIFPSLLLESYRNYLREKNILISETFEHDQLSEEKTKVCYKDIVAGKIIFSEGIGGLKNPYFPKGPFLGGKEYFIPNKGEYVIIKAPELKLETLLKGPVYVMPWGKDLYKVGASYKREDASLDITEVSKDIVLTKLRKMIACDFEVLSQEAGIRPTTKDRRPLLGSLSHSPNKVFFNGLGTHGIMNAPFLAEILYKHLENGQGIPVEMDIKRCV